jgi:hypothetical protein
VTLRREIVDLVRFRLLHEANQIRRVRHIAVVKEEIRSLDVGIFIEMIHALGVERGRPPLHPMHLIALAEQEFGKILVLIRQLT